MWVLDVSNDLLCVFFVCIIFFAPHLTASSFEQHYLIGTVNESTIDEIAHRGYSHTDVHDIAAWETSHENVDQIRSEARSHTYPLKKATLKYNDERAKLFFDELHIRVPATLNAFNWFNELLTETRDFSPK